MAAYKNVMETLVKNKLEEIIDTLDCCKCTRCRNDIIAFALNRLPTKYVVTAKGEVYSKVYTLSVQHDADILSALILGAQTVNAHPRHEASTKKK